MWPGPAVVFEDRFFSFLQEQDFNGSVVTFFGLFHVSSFPFTWGCSLDEFTILGLQIGRVEHLGIDANTSQFRHISRVTVSVRSLMRS